MNASSARLPITVEVVSDVVCPWCFIGKRRLDKAMAMTNLELAIRWRPFQLDPTIPPGGKDRRAYLEAKFGSPELIRQIHENVAAAGRGEGIPFAFDRIAVSPNTLDAHRVIRWSAEEGLQDRIVEALFSAYFLEGRDIGAQSELAAIAAETGLDRDAIAARLASDKDRDSVQGEMAEAQRIGVTGVPTFILDGRYGPVGAQPAEEIASAFRNIAAETPKRGVATR